MHRLLKANRCSLIAIGCFSQLSSHYHTSVNQPSNASKSTIDSLSDNQKSLRYKYVVVGYGTAAKTVVSGLIQGQSSTGRLKEKSSDILVIDPYQPPSSLSEKHPADFKSVHIKSIDPLTKCIVLEDDTAIYYEKCVLATGSLSNTIQAEKFIASDIDQSSLFDLSDPSNRNDLRDLASKGKHITMVGLLNWSIISYAISLGKVANEKGFKNNVTIVSPSSGLMISTFPKYISSILTKKLSTIYGIEIIPYSQLRYITNNSKYGSAVGEVAGKLMVYTGCTYDSVNTSFFETDAVVFDPATGVPNIHRNSSKDKIDDMNKMKMYRNQIWESILRTAGFEIDDDLKGIVVNRSLEAYRDVFIVGDLASIYSSTGGRGVYIGDAHGKYSGMFAVHQLLGDYKSHEYVPVYDAKSSELNLRMILVGHCSTAYETHGYWWKVKDKNLKKGKVISNVQSSNKSDQQFQFSYAAEESKEAFRNYSTLRGKSRLLYHMLHESSNKLNDKAIHLHEDASHQLGIVLYLDPNDIIRGALLYGKFTDDLDDKSIIDELRRFVNEPINMKELLAASAKSSRTMNDSDRLVKIQHLSRLAHRAMVSIIDHDEKYKSDIKESTGLDPFTAAGQYRYAGAINSSTQYYNSKVSSKSKPLNTRSQKENVFFNGPVNISQADRAAAGYAAILDASMKHNL